MEEPQLTLSFTGSYGVRIMRNCESVWGTGVCRQVGMNIQSIWVFAYLSSGRPGPHRCELGHEMVEDIGFQKGGLHAVEDDVLCRGDR